MSFQGETVPMSGNPAVSVRRISGRELEQAMLNAIQKWGPISFDNLLSRLEDTGGGWVDDVEAQEFLWNAIARGELLVSSDLTLRRQA